MNCWLPLFSPAQATDISVNKATEKLYPVANTPEAIVQLGTEGLMPYVKTINLYPTKPRNIVRMSEILLEKHHGKVPDNREDLEALPGVGRKTANVVLNTAFHQNVMAVDTHIFRVSNRTGLAPGKNVLEVEKRLVEVIPPKFMMMHITGCCFMVVMSARPRHFNVPAV